MPLKTWDIKQDFDAAYSVSAEPWGHPNTRPGVRLGYNRGSEGVVVDGRAWDVGLMGAARRRARRLVDLFGWPLTDGIVIVGAGFSWTVEALEDLGYTNVVGTDVSAYVQSEQDNDEEPDVDAAITAAGLDPASGEGLTIKGRVHSPGPRRRSSREVLSETLDSNGSRNRTRNQVGGTVHHLLTEDVLTSLNDEECNDNHANLLQLTSDVIHLVTPVSPLLSGAVNDPSPTDTSFVVSLTALDGTPVVPEAVPKLLTFFEGARRWQNRAVQSHDPGTGLLTLANGLPSPPADGDGFYLSSQQAGWNWKDLEGWQALIPGAAWVEAGTYRVLSGG